MLKRWQLSFNPTTKYFSFRHIWVLLLSFPLQMWNRKAMEAVGNSIGHLLKIEEEDLHSTNKKMAKILVEIDIHGGLLDVLEIEWRGLLFVQRLDYLGFLFIVHSVGRLGTSRRNVHRFMALCRMRRKQRIQWVIL